MQRAGRPVHINDTLTNSDGVLPTKYFIPRRVHSNCRTGLNYLWADFNKSTIFFINSFNPAAHSGFSGFFTISGNVLNTADFRCYYSFNWNLFSRNFRSENNKELNVRSNKDSKLQWILWRQSIHSKKNG